MHFGLKIVELYVKRDLKDHQAPTPCHGRVAWHTRSIQVNIYDSFKAVALRKTDVAWWRTGTVVPAADLMSMFSLQVPWGLSPKGCPGEAESEQAAGWGWGWGRARWAGAAQQRVPRCRAEHRACWAQLYSCTACLGGWAWHRQSSFWREHRSRQYVLSYLFRLLIKCRSGYGVRACVFGRLNACLLAFSFSLLFCNWMLVGFGYVQVCSWARIAVQKERKMHVCVCAGYHSAVCCTNTHTLESQNL